MVNCFTNDFSVEEQKDDLEYAMKGKGLSAMDFTRYYSLTRCQDLAKLITSTKPIKDNTIKQYSLFLNNMISIAFSAPDRIPMLEIVDTLMPVNIFSKDNISNFYLNCNQNFEALKKKSDVSNYNGIVDAFRNNLMQKYGKIKVKKAKAKAEAKLGDIKENDENNAPDGEKTPSLTRKLFGTESSKRTALNKSNRISKVNAILKTPSENNKATERSNSKLKVDDTKQRNASHIKSIMKEGYNPSK